MTIDEHIRIFHGYFIYLYPVFICFPYTFCVNIDTTDAVAIVHHCLVTALAKSVSDIHFDPNATNVTVRMRVDGELHHMCTYGLHMHDQVMRRVRIVTDIAIDDLFHPCDGRFTFSHNGIKYEIRVVITPSYYGQACTLRILKPFDVTLSLESLGFSRGDAEHVYNMVVTRKGALLVSGPTGSGKTTTVYALLKKLTGPDTCVITLEDPIEYVFEGIRQIQIKTSTDFTFGAGLRSILRQDPDIVFVGEMRDMETARIAISAALTGHTLLSTIHTHSALHTISRLMDMSIEPYLIASAVSVVISQRLVKKICEECKVPYLLHEKEQAFMNTVEKMERNKDQLFMGKGCSLCAHTGYKGRIALYEIMSMHDALAQYIGKAHEEMRNVWIGGGGKPMLHDALEKMRSGCITIKQVMSLYADEQS